MSFVKRSSTKILSLSLVIFLISSSILLNAQPGDREPSPPELFDCNRIEIEFRPSVVSFFITHHNIWSEEELAYFESLNPFVSEDINWINRLASIIYESSYLGEAGPGGPRMVTDYRITCFKDDEKIASFVIKGNFVYTDSHVFGLFYSDWGEILRGLTPELRPYDVRDFCAINIDILGSYLWNPYPDPNQWCDHIHSYFQSSYFHEYTPHLSSPFRCPAVNESHYAMNPLCEPNSPDETVLLFETTTGWNKHGGPELFTFDNHDPKGGMVLLNDGTVKFIRTEEELNMLRWNPDDPNSPEDASD